jgi:hypothetical protein
MTREAERPAGDTSETPLVIVLCLRAQCGARIVRGFARRVGIEQIQDELVVRLRVEIDGERVGRAAVCSLI